MKFRAIRERATHYGSNFQNLPPLVLRIRSPRGDVHARLSGVSYHPQNAFFFLFVHFDLFVFLRLRRNEMQLTELMEAIDLLRKADETAEPPKRRDARASLISEPNGRRRRGRPRKSEIEA